MLGSTQSSSASLKPAGTLQFSNNTIEIRTAAVSWSRLRVVAFIWSLNDCTGWMTTCLWASADQLGPIAVRSATMSAAHLPSRPLAATATCQRGHAPRLCTPVFLHFNIEVYGDWLTAGARLQWHFHPGLFFMAWGCGVNFCITSQWSVSGEVGVLWILNLKLQRVQPIKLGLTVAVDYYSHKAVCGGTSG